MAGAMLSDLPHFNNAARYRRALVALGAGFALVGCAAIGPMLAQAIAPRWASLAVPGAFGDAGAALLVAAGGLLAAAFMARSRETLLAAELEARPRAGDAPEPSPHVASFLRARWRRRERRRPSRLWAAAWPSAFIAIAFGAAAIAGVAVAWRAPPAPLEPERQQLVAVAFILAAFPLLVLQRSYAVISASALPEAPQLARLLRVPLTASLGLGIASFLPTLGFSWSLPLARAVAVLIAATAAELALRGIATAFLPQPPPAQWRAVADSSLAGLLRLAPPNFARASGAVRRQFGIDLSRSWALAYLRRAAGPAALGMAVFAWCLTGLTALGIDERGVYERLGVPVAVFGPGLHLHEPWPIGVVRRVELGVIHEIPIVFPVAAATGQGAAPSAAAAAPPPAGAEDEPPASADRLWDGLHPSEASYLIASQSLGQQSFQIVNIDLRVVYRVGLSDAAARDAVYRIADREALIRAVASQLLARHFARYTLLDVLGQSREAFARDFRNALQAQLDALSTGVEAIAVIVEAIHPPPAAASAYHNVQAAEIRANSQIAVRRGEAIQTVKSAEQEALRDRNAAIAGAAELVDQARGESILFEGDRQADHRDGQAFILERWFDRLSSALARSQFILIDHRLAGAAAPTIDLRSFALPLDAGQAPPKGKAPAPAGDQGAPSDDED